MYGYAGAILRVNLSNGHVSKQDLPSQIERDYLGARGLNAYLLYTEVPAGADPYGSGNKLLVAPGPLSGTMVPGACKMDFAAKSPLTGGYGSTSVGGFLAAELRFAGYDGIIVEGKSPHPVYLFIDDGHVELREAAELWGRGWYDTEACLKHELGADFQIASIGPAGENLVRYACINHDFGRQAARCGVGAVMGSKRLKAIAVRGTGSIPVADPAGFVSICKELTQACKQAPAHPAWVRYGTLKTTEWLNKIGTLPTRNFQAGALDEAANLYGPIGREKLILHDMGCFACPAPCGKYSHSRKYDLYLEGPDYETVGLVGPNVGISDFDDVARINWLCDDLGLDSISAGGCIAWAMECYEKGILSPEQTSGLDLDWGNAGTVFELVKRIARREGFLGDLLAEGTRRAAVALGGGSEQWAVHTKGMELSGYGCHSATATLLSYMTSDIGGHHGRAWGIHYDLTVGREAAGPDKAAKIIELQHIRPLLDCLGACRFLWVELGLPLSGYARALQALTGIERSWEDLLHVSERVWNLTRLYWAREVPDFGRACDAPPPRFTQDPCTYGPTQGKFTQPEIMDKMLDDYYAQRGWDANGLPLAETLSRLGLSGVASGVPPVGS